MFTPALYSENPRHLSEMLHYSLENKQQKDLPKLKIEFKFLLKATFETILALKNREFRIFDSLVGEHLCQSRALKVALAAPHAIPSFQEIEYDVEEALNKIREIKSLEELIGLNYSLILNSDELFFVMSYLLTVVKIVNASDNYFKRTEKTDVKQLSNKISPVCRKFSRKIVNHLREKLSVDSVEFVKRLARHTQDPMDREIVSMERILKNKLHCIPFFRGTNVLLEAALHYRIPIAVLTQQLTPEKDKIVREVAVFYACYNDNYYMRPPEIGDYRSPILVIKGVTCQKLARNLPNKKEWQKQINRHKPHDLVLACSATHSQYPDIKEALLSQNSDILYRHHLFGHKFA